MKRRLRRFVLVGVLITGLDVAMLLYLGLEAGFEWFVADTISVVVAAGASFFVHRIVTFSDDAHALIDHRPRSFAMAVWPAVVSDIAVVSIITAVVSDSTPTAVVAKVLAVAVASWIRLLRYRRVLFAVVRAEQLEPSTTLGDDGPRLTVVLPAYNAEDDVADSVASLRKALADVEADGGLEIIVADDGSADRTVEAARTAGATVVALEENQGKGAAVRAGMLAATGRSRIFTDVDLAYPPHQLIAMLDVLEADADVVVGSRRHGDTEAVYRGTRLRELGSLVFNLFTHVALLGQYRDTQSGIKGFRSDAAEAIFSRTVVNGFAFDVEVLHLVERYRLGLREMPVVLDNVDDSTVSFAADTLKMVSDVFAIRRRAALGQYDRDADSESTSDAGP